MHPKTTYVIPELGVELTFEPDPDNIVPFVKDDKLVVHYLSRDLHFEMDPQEPDNACVLVHYHRQFWLDVPKLITKDQVAAFYQGVKSGSWHKTHRGFPVSAYIHSGVYLFLGNHAYPGDPNGWDTSHVGMLLVHKKYIPKKRAEAAAESYLAEWNSCLSGDVWGVITETFDLKTKKALEPADSCWGYIGRDSALDELAERTK